MDVKKVRVIFILPETCKNEEQASDEMQQAFELCKQNVMNVEWIREEHFSNIDLQKTDFLVFQTFEGKNFDELKATKCTRILGPWCLLTCLTEGIPIPNVPWPIYNVAMRDCYITCSFLPKKKKQEVKETVMLMAGHYTDGLSEGNTHVISDSVRSEKYIKAAEAGQKLMLPSWVGAVWEASLMGNVHGDDKQFEKYRIPPLHNLTICCTGFNDPSDRQQIEKMINSKGGKYSGALRVNSTDLLICKCGTNSEKYKAAKKTNKIKCVNVNWLTDSIEKGYAMPEDNYPVKVGTSTPTKDGENVDPNFSMVSAIGLNSIMHASSPIRNTFCETMNSTGLPMQLASNDRTPKSTKESLKRKGSPNSEYKELVENIDLKKVKKAGAFLDGCSVYLAGFTMEHREKLCKVLNFSGATRYDAVNERMTHIIVGDPSCHELKVIKSKGLNVCPMVTIHWLLASLDVQQPVAEENYLISSMPTAASDDYSSPLSKKGLSLLRSNVTVVEAKTPTPPVEENNKAEAEEIMQQYLRSNASSQEDTLAQLLQNENFQSKSTVQTNETENKHVFEPPEASKANPERTLRPQEPSTQITQDFTCSMEESCQPIFEGRKFMLINFMEEEVEKLKGYIETMYGEVVPKSYKGIPDYAVVPLFNEELRQTCSEVVNDLWVSECWANGELMEIMYYHRPMNVPDLKPLKGCVIAMSAYTNFERTYLKHLVEKLGGVSQEQFARVASIGKNILPSTHLISAEASGKKYDAALRWNRPVVDKNWLLECARTGKLVSENKYLVGDAVAPERPELSSTPKSDVSSTAATVGTVTPTAAVTTPKQTNLVGTPQNVNLLRQSISNRRESIQTPANVSTAENNSATPNKSNRDQSLEAAANLATPTSHNLQGTTDFNTPLNKVRRSDSTSDICSQVTPVNKIMAEARMNNLLGTPDSPPVSKPWDHVDTPETPLGAFIRDNPSPNLRKQMVRYLNQFPDYQPPTSNRRQSTPLSELKRKLWNNICPPRSSQEENIPVHPEPTKLLDQFEVEPSTPKKKGGPDTQDVIGQKLQQIENMLTSSAGSRKSIKKRESIIPVQATTEVKDSQAFTVGWDYMECENTDDNSNSSSKKQVPIFMISGLNMDERQELVLQLEQLGASVSELSSYDPTCTHLICPKPSRNEKLLCCMAAGKWILHTSYVEQSLAARQFLDEELFEFGNPKSEGNVPVPLDKETETRVQGVHWWRKEISRRGYGAFHDMRAIVVATKRDPIVRVIEAGGGMVVDASPPFEETDSIYATHCLLELKSVPNVLDYAPLAKKGIYCVNTLYISDFLNRTASDIRDCIIPHLSKHYANR